MSTTDRHVNFISFDLYSKYINLDVGYLCNSIFPSLLLRDDDPTSGNRISYFAVYNKNILDCKYYRDILFSS